MRGIEKKKNITRNWNGDEKKSLSKRVRESKKAFKNTHREKKKI